MIIKVIIEYTSHSYFRTCLSLRGPPSSCPPELLICPPAHALRRLCSSRLSSYRNKSHFHSNRQNTRFSLFVHKFRDGYRAERSVCTFAVGRMPKTGIFVLLYTYSNIHSVIWAISNKRSERNHNSQCSCVVFRSAASLLCYECSITTDIEIIHWASNHVCVVCISFVDFVKCTAAVDKTCISLFSKWKVKEKNTQKNTRMNEIGGNSFKWFPFVQINWLSTSHFVFCRKQNPKSTQPPTKSLNFFAILLYLLAEKTMRGMQSNCTYAIWNGNQSNMMEFLIHIE